ncbi:hypothetical protein A3770_14p71030 [Chloropicon primus]|uniref:Zinc/iron permease n=1 Tax=Chloropicon primus TaxID=1764295 RepID=A0A5B8MY90_9CHLO|nr:hypothetical protein A3770_14p71030 [Chloropicon primus]|mmetsp:Transcript_1921/g.5234  ORF Transcript_1921/g.5234 Transcript_1921/m.5234 type:complete len:358 (-) Transcript_1921:635-1708(-)|eukprot:QDZ24585.1 hypothetical protein A3770_14p71030 [Chloropicon primus]
MDAPVVGSGGLGLGGSTTTTTTTTGEYGGYDGTTSPATVFYCTLVMALTTGLGAVPFFFTDRLDKFSEGVAQSMAIGVMIAASYALIQESEGLNNAWLVVGLAAGMVFIDRSQKVLARHEDGMEFIGLKGADAKKILLFLGIMTLHAVGEGCGVGVSYAGPQGFPKGLLITMAIGIHNIPEGLATATILASKNVGKRDMVLWTVFTALPQTLLAVPAYMFVQVFHSLFPFFAGFAAGCMIWISFAEIIPDALENVSPSTMATTATTTTFAFKAMQYALNPLLLGTSQPLTSSSFVKAFLGALVLLAALVCLRKASERWLPWPRTIGKGRGGVLPKGWMSAKVAPSRGLFPAEVQREV